MCGRFKANVSDVEFLVDCCCIFFLDWAELIPTTQILLDRGCGIVFCHKLKKCMNLLWIQTLNWLANTFNIFGHATILWIYRDTAKVKSKNSCQIQLHYWLWDLKLFANFVGEYAPGCCVPIPSLPALQDQSKSNLILKIASRCKA